MKRIQLLTNQKKMKASKKLIIRKIMNKQIRPEENLASLTEIKMKKPFTNQNQENYEKNQKKGLPRAAK